LKPQKLEEIRNGLSPRSSEEVQLY
jgi:hypothetical protein